MNTHTKFVLYGKNAKEWMQKCELLLPEIARKKIWKKKRYGSIYEYAAKLAGMNKRKVDDCLRIYRKIEDKPELMEVAEKKGLGAVRPVVTVATKENAEFLAEKVETMSRRATESYVKSYKNESCHVTESQPAKVQISMELDPEIAQKLQKMKGDQDWNQFMEKLMTQEKPKTVKIKSHNTPKAIQDYALNKTNGKCACCNRKYHAFHHIDRFSEHHEHDPDKIIPLCKGCHQLAHLGYIENEHDPPHLWRVREQPKPSATDLKYQKYAKQAQAS